MTIKGAIKKLVPKFLLNIYHFKLAITGAIIFGFPGQGKKIKIIGVTGTSGKSTTTDFITRILEEAGNGVASISTVRFKIGDKEWKNELKMTMPGRFKIQKFLRQAINEKCNFAVLEVSSEGIRQYRHKFINFDAAVFTNLSPEHIESHGSFENYRNEKIKLFKATKNVHVINADDKNAKYFLEIPANKKISFKIKEAEDVEINSGLSFKIQDTRFQIPIMGEFNIYNALAAISVAKAYGIDFETCKRALEKVKGIPGRMEIVAKNPLVVVDYAHTPDQLEKVYKTLKNFKFKISNFKLVCVLGSCGGGRDKWKRPELGKIAARYCNKIIITNEDPYDENPNQILSEIKSGISNFKFPAFTEVSAGKQISNFYEILDRREAIKKAIELAKPNDTVIITGKGSEPWMCLANGKKILWDDRKIARESLKIDF